MKQEKAQKSKFR